MKLKLRTPYNYDRAVVSHATGLACVFPGKTVQSQKDETDINVIWDRLMKTGSPLPVAPPPTHADFTEARDFQESQNLILAARASFMALPANFRAKLDNDPAAFVDYAQDPENLPELRKLGLAIPEAPAKEAPPVASPAV